jgi:hypothetical protein
MMMEAFMSNQQKVNFKIKFKNATTLIGFFVDDVGNFINKLLQAGADLLSPPRIMIMATGREILNAFGCQCMNKPQSKS